MRGGRLRDVPCKYGNLGWKLLEFWVGGHLWEVVANEMWSFTRCSEYGNLSWKFLVFWIGGHLWEVVVY